MSRARFNLQAAFVLSLIVLVSWPEHRQARAVTVWRADGPLATRWGGVARDGRFGAGDALGRRFEIGYGSATLERTSAAGATSLSRKLYGNDIEGGRRFVTPPAVLALGGRINAIRGYARSALNGPVPYARLLLRNIETGEVEARATADEDGRFTFLDIMPSGYIVELLGPDGAVIATSEFVPVGLGDVKETTVRVPGSQSVLAMFGTLTGTADEPLGTAAGSGVQQVAAPDASISPLR